MICSKCGHDNKEGAKFCNECGTSLSAPDISGEIVLENDTSSSEVASEDIHKTAALDLPPFTDEDFSDEEEEEEFDVPAIATDDPTTPAIVDEFVVDADTSGFDEYLLDSSYVPPQKSWKSGDTMEMPRVEDEPSAQKVEYRAPEKEKQSGKGKKIALVSIILLVLAALVAGAVTYQLELWGGKSLPNVEELNVVEATQVLSDSGFAVKVMEVKSDDVEGKVLLMDPGPGRRLSEGSEVVLQVAVSRVIPEVTGQDVTQALEALETEGFENIEQVKQRSDEAENVVLAITPEVGEKAEARTKITLTIAEPYRVPDVTGLDIEAAYAALEAEGFAVAEYYVYSEATEYTVVESDPAVGSAIASGSTVTIHIAKSRSSELISATNNYLGLGLIELDGTTYDIQSIDSVKYIDYSTTRATLTVVGMTTLPDGEQVYGSPKQRTVSFTWNDDGSLAGYSQ